MELSRSIRLPWGRRGPAIGPTSRQLEALLAAGEHGERRWRVSRVSHRRSQDAPDLIECRFACREDGGGRSHWTALVTREDGRWALADEWAVGEDRLAGFTSGPAYDGGALQHDWRGPGARTAYTLPLDDLRRIAHDSWDPLDLGEAAPTHAYDAFLIEAVARLRRGEAASDVVAWLRVQEAQTIGRGPPPGSPRSAARMVAALRDALAAFPPGPLRMQ